MTISAKITGNAPDLRLYRTGNAGNTQDLELWISEDRSDDPRATLGQHPGNAVTCENANGQQRASCSGNAWPVGGGRSGNTRAPYRGGRVARPTPGGSRPDAGAGEKKIKEGTWDMGKAGHRKYPVKIGDLVGLAVHGASDPDIGPGVDPRRVRIGYVHRLTPFGVEITVPSWEREADPGSRAVIAWHRIQEIRWADRREDDQGQDLGGWHVDCLIEWRTEWTQGRTGLEEWRKQRRTRPA